MCQNLLPQADQANHTTATNPASRFLKSMLFWRGWPHKHHRSTIRAFTCMAAISLLILAACSPAWELLFEPFHLMLFFDFFSIRPMPSNTLVMSYIRLFWTCDMCQAGGAHRQTGKPKVIATPGLDLATRPGRNAT